MSKFYVGQRVKDCVCRPTYDGVIESVIDLADYPIRVRWDSGEYDDYSLDGRILKSYIPTLIGADDAWYIVHNPAVKFEEWERVLVRDDLGYKWKARVFKQKTDFGTYLDSDGIPWLYCRKWDENLVGKVTED